MNQDGTINPEGDYVGGVRRLAIDPRMAPRKFHSASREKDIIPVNKHLLLSNRKKMNENANDFKQSERIKGQLLETQLEEKQKEKLMKVISQQPTKSEAEPLQESQADLIAMSLPLINPNSRDVSGKTSKSKYPFLNNSDNDNTGSNSCKKIFAEKKLSYNEKIEDCPTRPNNNSNINNIASKSKPNINKTNETINTILQSQNNLHEYSLRSKTKFISTKQKTKLAKRKGDMTESEDEIYNAKKKKRTNDTRR